MAKSRKRKPSFDGPADAQGPSDTDWVYRSEPPDAADRTVPAIVDRPPVQAGVPSGEHAPGPLETPDNPPAHSVSEALSVRAPAPVNLVRREAAAPLEDDAVALNIVDRHALYAAGAGLLPIPLIDTAAIAGVQVAMVRSLAEHYTVPFSRERVKAVVTAIAGGVAPVTAGRSAMKFLMNQVPIAGTLFAYTTVSVFAGAVTYAVGRVFMTHFASGGSLDDIDVERSRQMVATHVEVARVDALPRT